MLILGIISVLIKLGGELNVYHKKKFMWIMDHNKYNKECTYEGLKVIQHVNQ